MEICRAGFGPPPACRALPKIVSSTCSGLDSGTLDRRFGGDYAHVGRGQRGERSAEFANRRADGGENIDGLQSVSSKRLSLAGREKDAGRFQSKGIFDP